LALKTKQNKNKQNKKQKNRKNELTELKEKKTKYSIVLFYRQNKLRKQIYKKWGGFLGSATGTTRKEIKAGWGKMIPFSQD
jgi:hypothetical protein